MPKRIIRPRAVHPTQGYVHGVLTHGGLLFVSGQVAKNAADESVGADNPEVQLVQVFENLKGVLAEAGGSFADVVKINVYFTDRSQLLAYRKVRAQYMTSDDQAVTGMIVQAMPNPAWLMEIEIVADLGKPRRRRAAPAGRKPRRRTRRR
ncbi:MAG: RidA family protein [Alphaproteobacteria bacterium]|nr:RidA family protein [Alphaproteobacteria bacterium]